MTDLSLLDRLVETDRALTLALNTSNQGGGDSFWMFLSSNAATIPVYVLAIAMILLAAGWKRGLVYILAAALAVGASDMLCNLVKDSVCRLRPGFDPYMLENGIRVLIKSSPGHCCGFWSAHSALSFALATASSAAVLWGLRGRIAAGERCKRIRPAAIVYIVFVWSWAVLVALSRVFVAKHFLGDILVGAIAGIVMALICVYIARYIAGKAFRHRYNKTTEI